MRISKVEEIGKGSKQYDFCSIDLKSRRKSYIYYVRAKCQRSVVLLALLPGTKP